MPGEPQIENQGSPVRRRIVLTTFGSLGDLHPFLALALGLKARGHEAIIGTHESYRKKIEAEGIGFRPVRPDFPDRNQMEHVMKQVMDLRKGPDFLIRKMIMPYLCQSYEDLTAAADGAELLVSHAITFAARLVAEKQGLNWVSTVLAPTSLFSAYDPPMLAPAPALGRLRCLGPWFFKPMLGLLKWGLYSWTEPVRQLRREIGLPPSDLNPLFEGQFSPLLNLVLFSSFLGKPQPDWPPNTRIAGFPFYDRQDKETGINPELTAFLEAGDPPIVFTLGSSAVMCAGDFYRLGARAARNLGKRAVLLIGQDRRNHPAQPLPQGVAAFEYAPYSELFSRAVAIVHQGGIGTTGQGLRSGRPMLVVPYAFDQPDNADRVARLGVGRVVPRRMYTERRVTKELHALLGNPSYALRAAEVGQAIQAENGVAAACDAIECCF